MSTLISKATGNWTAAGTWNLADPTSELDSEVGNTSTTTSFVGSSNFTPGAITVDAVAVKFLSRSASPTGTFTVELYNSTGAASVAQVAVDVADLPLNGGWVVFPIGSTLLLAATNYQVRVKSSTTAMANVYRNSTAGNWSRQLRTTTTQAPVAGDKLIVAGEHTGSGTGNDFTVTMDETATTSYGAVAFAQSISVNKRATLSYGTTAATAYYLRVKGMFKIFDSGTFTIGTTGTPIPSTSSAVLEFDPTAAADSGLAVANLGTFIAQGNPLTYDRAYLAADAAAAATALTTDVSTGWLSGDEVGFAPTERTIAQFEKRTLSGNAVATAFSVTAGLTYAHNGTSVYAKGEVVNLTRNVKIRGTSASLVGYSSYSATSSANIDWVEFYFMGNATSSTGCMAVSTSTGGSFSVENSSIHDITVTNTPGIRVISTSPDGITISNNVFYNVTYIGVYFSGTGNFIGTIAVSNNWTIGGSYGILMINASGTFTNNRSSGATTGISFGGGYYGPIGTISGNTAHACQIGLNFTSLNDGNINSSTAFRCTSFGIELLTCVRVVATTADARENSTGNLRVTSCNDCTFNSFTLNGGATYATSYGIYLGGWSVNTILYNSTFGSTTTHTSSDILPSGQTSNITFHKCTFSSGTEYGISINKPGAQYESQDHQTTIGNNKIVKYEGVISRDTTIFNSASPSMRMAPAITNVKLESPFFTTAVASGGTVTVSVSIRKSTVGDGTAYNGSQPTLVLHANPAAGIAADTILDTMTVAAGTWETLTATTAAVTEDTRLEFFIDADGDAGWVNIDDIVLLSEQTAAFKYWVDGKPYVVGSPASSGSGSAFTFVS